MGEYDAVRNLQRLFTQKSILDIALEVIGLLDMMEIFVYAHWIDGEIVDGPNVSRYWVKLTLKYPYKKMPDPMGARVLHDIGVKVNYKKDITMEPIKINSPADFRPQSKKPKLLPDPCWYIELKIPRRFIDEIDYNDIDQYDEDEQDGINMKDVVKATDQGLTVANTDRNQEPEQPPPEEQAEQLPLPR